jgi:hypothetical protein
MMHHHTFVTTEPYVQLQIGNTAIHCRLKGGERVFRPPDIVPSVGEEPGGRERKESGHDTALSELKIPSSK